MHKTEVLTLLLCAFAALLHGLSGFGFPMVSTAALSMFYSLQTAVAMVIIPCIILNLSLLQAGKNHSFFQNILHYLKQYWGLIGSSLIGSFIGVGLLLYVNEGYLKLIMGSVILLYVLDQFRSQPFQVSRSFKNMPLASRRSAPMTSRMAFAARRSRAGGAITIQPKWKALMQKKFLKSAKVRRFI